MSGIKVRDLAWGRFAAPDLDRAEQFLTDFGLTRLERSADRLYMRGADGGPFLHVTEQGDPRFLGAAFLLDSADDLARAARLPGASAIEPLDGPCDGQRVRVAEPNGYVIELTCKKAGHDEALDPARNGAREKLDAWQQGKHGVA